MGTQEVPCAPHPDPHPQGSQPGLQGVLAQKSLSVQSVPKEINPEYSLEGLMLNLKLQFFGLLMQRADFSEKTLMLGETEGRKRRGQQRMR